MSSPDEQHWTEHETAQWLTRRTTHPWSVWRGERTRRWWAVPLWPTAPAIVIDADHHRDLAAAMGDVERNHDGRPLDTRMPPGNSVDDR